MSSANNKKIVILRHKLSQFGGAELVLVKEAEHLKKLGHDVTVVVFEWNEEEFKHRLENVEVKTLRGSNLFKQLISLRQFIRNFCPDVVIAHENGYIHLFLSTLLISNKPQFILRMYGVAIWLLGSELNNAWFFRKKMKTIQQKLEGHKEFIDLYKRLGFRKRIKAELHAILDFFAVRNFDFILTFAKHTAWEIKELYGKEALIIPAGAETDYFNSNNINQKNLKRDLGYKSDENLIMTVNRLDPRKRIGLLIRSFAKIVKNLNTTKLVIIGKGPQESELRGITEELGIKDKVDFRGFIKDEDLKKFYIASDIIAYPAWCAWGLVPLEALALNKKVVIAEDAMVQEVIANLKNVIVTEPAVDSLGDALLKAIYMPSSNSRDFIKHNIDWSIHFGKLNKIIGLCTAKKLN